ncbi:MAG: hypothetical protein IT380_09970 [Myxococcales bacterium]|nr:hypothetical protein [Myxococcales bacterium]
MARKPKSQPKTKAQPKAKTKAKPKVRESAKAVAGLKRTPPDVSSVEVAEALHDVVKLAVRVFNASQRATSLLNESDRRQLGAFVDLIRRGRHLIPAAGKSRAQLTPGQLVAGTLRQDFDDLCSFAAKEPQTPERDKLLAEHLHRSVIAESELNLTVADVEAAIARRQLAAKEFYSSAGAAPGTDWLTADERRSPVFAAGELLADLLRTHPGIDASPTRSSTTEYAKRIEEADQAILERSGSRGETIGFLAYALGVPLVDIPWFAHQIDLLVQESYGTSGRLGRRPGGALRPPPLAYGALADDFRQEVVAATSARLAAAGIEASRPEAPPGNEHPSVLVESYLGIRSSSAGKQAASGRRAPPSNPWKASSDDSTNKPPKEG